MFGRWDERWWKVAEGDAELERLSTARARERHFLAAMGLHRVGELQGAADAPR